MGVSKKTLGLYEQTLPVDDIHDWIVLQAFLGFALPFINFPAMLYFFEHDSLVDRFKLCAVGAFAMMFGSTIMLLMIRAGYGLGSKM